MNKAIVFDMDGTIADLYSVPNWLEKLRSYDETPYRDASPIYDMAEIRELLELLKLKTYKIIVVSWLSKETTREYDKAVRNAKRKWLQRYSFPADEIHIVKYGTKKTRCVKGLDSAILFDDDEKVRNSWTLGDTVDPLKENIIDVLRIMLDE